MGSKRKRKPVKRPESGPVAVSEPVSVAVVREAGVAPTVRPEAAISEALGRSVAPIRNHAGAGRERLSLECPKCGDRTTSFDGPGVCKADGVAVRVIGRVLVRV